MIRCENINRYYRCSVKYNTHTHTHTYKSYFIIIIYNYVVDC